jgi:hypothetical protein
MSETLNLLRSQQAFSRLLGTPPDDPPTEQTRPLHTSLRAGMGLVVDVHHVLDGELGVALGGG